MFRCAPLIALIYSKQNVGEYGVTGSIHSNCLPIGSSGMHSLLAAEGMSAYDYQKRTLYSFNVVSQCLKSIRQFFTSRHSSKQSEDYLFAEAEPFIFSCTRLLLHIRIIFNYKYIILTLKPFVKRNFKLFISTSLEGELDAFASFSLFLVFQYKYIISTLSPFVKKFFTLFAKNFLANSDYLG